MGACRGAVTCAHVQRRPTAHVATARRCRADIQEGRGRIYRIRRALIIRDKLHLHLVEISGPVDTGDALGGVDVPAFVHARADDGNAREGYPELDASRFRAVEDQGGLFLGQRELIDGPVLELGAVIADAGGLSAHKGNGRHCQGERDYQRQDDDPGADGSSSGHLLPGWVGGGLGLAAAADYDFFFFAFALQHLFLLMGSLRPGE